MTHSIYVKNSALWAAYGDALGFISELANSSSLFQRTGLRKLEKTVPWRRRIGGKFGVTVDLPAGCYSDDTELRLCTSRAIRSNGEFDVEAFSKVELPVWLVYALGAGKGSKAAANNLFRSGVTWMTNFYDTDGLSYVSGGGNGAAMRIQPHVWAASDGIKPETFLSQVLRNAICTHGHPRGIAGAAFHALSVHRALSTNIVPRPDEWREFIHNMAIIPELIVSDNHLASFWLPTWEKLSGLSLKDSFYKTFAECLEDVESVANFISSGRSFEEIVESVGCLGPELRGSGTKTAILAGVLALLYRVDPNAGLVTASNLLGSDTDTIASMAGAIIGATVKDEPAGDIKDKAYIQSEALRLYKVSTGEVGTSYNYPDLLRWALPSSPLDFVGVADEKLCIAGLGVASSVREVATQTGKYPSKWQWVDLSDGQSVLAKSRTTLMPIPATMLPGGGGQSKKKEVSPMQDSLFDNRIYPRKELKPNASRVAQLRDGYGRDTVQAKSQQNLSSLTLDEATKKAIDSGFDPTLIGNLMLEIATRRNGIELVVAFSSIIAKAKIARLNSK